MKTKDPTGGKTPPENEFSMKPVPPDDPIYSRGFVIGGIGRNRLPEDEVAAARKRAFLRKLAETIGEEMMDQFKGKK